MSLKAKVQIAVACFLLLSGCRSIRYGDKLNSTWQQVFSLSAQDGSYRWSGYPVDNFGVLTAYDPPAGQAFKDSDRICATWTCIDVPATSVPTGHDARLTVNGFVDAGGGGAITLTQKQSTDIAVALLLPNLAQVADINASLKSTRGVTTVVTLGRAYKRSADRNKYLNFISSSSTNNTLKTAFTNGRMTWVADDIVADSFDVDITVDTSTNADLDAKLKKAVQAVASDSSAKISFQNTATGKYHISVTNPVILAVQTRVQPGGGVLAGKGLGGLSDQPQPMPNYHLFR